jgi:hypothetical protein
MAGKADEKQGMICFQGSCIQLAKKDGESCRMRQLCRFKVKKSAGVLLEGGGVFDTYNRSSYGLGTTCQ